jgi:hypothetical protein
MRTKFHEYGVVEVSIEDLDEPTHDRCTATYAKYDGTLYEERETGETVTDETGFPEPELGWFTMEFAPERVTDEHVIELLDAAAVLCQHDYEQWKAADAAMGDPHP